MENFFWSPGLRFTLKASSKRLLNATAMQWIKCFYLNFTDSSAGGQSPLKKDFVLKVVLADIIQAEIYFSALTHKLAFP